MCYLLRGGNTGKEPAQRLLTFASWSCPALRCWDVLCQRYQTYTAAASILFRRFLAIYGDNRNVLLFLRTHFAEQGEKNPVLYSRLYRDTEITTSDTNNLTSFTFLVYEES